MIARINNAQNRVLTSVFNDGRLNRLLEQEALDKANAYTLAAMLDDLRRGIWSEAYTGRAADAYRRELQNDFLSQIDRKLNPPATPAAGQGGGGGGGFGQPQAPLSDDAKSHLRGTLVQLRTDLQRAAGSASDRATRMHFQGAAHRIDEILDPRK